MKVVRAHLHAYRLPLREVVVTARGRFSEREGWLLELVDAGGERGWGDAAPWVGFGVDEPPAVEAALRDLCAGGELARTFDDVEAVAAWLERTPLPGSAAHAVDLALLDLLARERGLSIAALLAPSPEEAVPVSAVVADAAAARAAPAATLKVKIGAAGWPEDLARLHAIRAAASRSRLRLDANGALPRSAAPTITADLLDLEVELLEQPGPTEDLPAWTGRGVPIAADESVAEAACGHDARAAVERLGAVDAVVLKPMFVGGILAAQRLAVEAGARGIAHVVTCAWESAIGRTGALHLAAALGGPHAAGLLGVVAEDVADGPRLEGGRLHVPAGAGLGVQPSLDRLGRAA